MHVGTVVVRVFCGIGMLNHAAEWLGLHDDPPVVTLLQVVSHLHPGTGGAVVLWAKLDLGVGLIAIDGNTANVQIHGAHVEGADGGQVLQDTGADSVLVTRLLLAGADADTQSEKAQDQGQPFHAKSPSHLHLCNLQINEHYFGSLDDQCVAQSPIIDHSYSIAHEKGEGNVHDGQNGEGITKRPMDDVP